MNQNKWRRNQSKEKQIIRVSMKEIKFKKQGEPILQDKEERSKLDSKSMNLRIGIEEHCPIKKLTDADSFKVIKDFKLKNLKRMRKFKGKC